MLRDYQSYALKKIIENDRSFLFWPRQTGKDYIISKFLEQFVNDNSDSAILYICDYKNHIHWYRDKLINNIHNCVRRSSEFEIKFIKNNRLIFCSIDDDFFELTRGLNTKIIIYNDAYRERNFGLLKNFIYSTGCKCIFASWQISTKMMDVIDSNDNFYVNVMICANPDALNADFKINKDIVNYFKYKKKEMFDYMNKSFQRKRKLQKLNEVEDEIKL